MKELIEIQSRLSVPKNRENTYGKYRYRSAEDILEAVKPLLQSTETHLTITDEVELIGVRYYVKATATIKNSKGDAVSVSAYAREEEARKGMDASQLTGSCSSYARKYALNGLFAIDDCQDADADEGSAKKANQQAPARNQSTYTAAPKSSTGKELWATLTTTKKNKAIEKCAKMNKDVTFLAQYYIFQDGEMESVKDAIVTKALEIN